jgi:tetratricopeptide (TPR) repeat protein
MNFGQNLFISYAHIDNQPLTPGEKGWITRFHVLAEQAENIARQFLAKNPGDFKFKHLLYASAFRVGDAVSDDNAKRAETEYRAASDIADELAKSAPDSIDGRSDLAFIAKMIGDLNKDRRNWPAAMEQYQISLHISQTLADQYPDSPDWRRDVAATTSRIGQGLVKKGDYAGALSEYQAALEIQMQLLRKNSDNDAVRSNLVF